MISQIIAKTMESFEMKLPRSTVNISEIRRKYHAALEAERSSLRKPEN